MINYNNPVIPVILPVIVYILIFYLVGSLIKSTLLRRTGTKLNFAEELVVGLSLCLILAGWSAFLNQENYILIGSVIFLSMVSVINLITSSIESIKGISINADLLVKFKLKLVVAVFFVITDMTLLVNHGLNANRFTYRNGPDLFGWTSSSRWFCQNGTVSDLENRIKLASGVSKVTDAFILPKPKIYAIPSVTDQINAEFIVGSNRFAIQKFIGSFCEFSGSMNLISLVTGFIIAITVLIFLSFYYAFRKYGISENKSIIYSLGLSIGFNILAPLMEGGLGQYLSFLLLFSILILSESSHLKNNQVPFLIIVSALAMAYFDGLIFLIIFVCTLFFFFAVQRRITLPQLIGNSKSFFTFSLFFIFFSFPTTKNFIRAIHERVSGHSGGWNQGRFPLIGDIAGVFNWLPDDSLSSTKFGFLALVVNCLFLLSFSVVLKIKNKFMLLKNVFYVFLTLYFYFICEVYVLHKENINNYNLLKYGQYMTGFSFVLMVILSVNNAKERKNKGRFQNSRYFEYFVIGAIFIASFNYQYGYVSNSKQTLDLKENKGFQRILANYDVYVFGFQNPGTVVLTIFGDLRFGNPSRGFEVSSERSTPARELVIATPRDFCSINVCQYGDPNKNNTLRKLRDFPNISIYKIS